MNRVEYSHRWNPFQYFSVYRLFLRVSAEGERCLISIALVIRGCSWPSAGVLLPGIVWKSLKMCVISVEVKKKRNCFSQDAVENSGTARSGGPLWPGMIFFAAEGLFSFCWMQVGWEAV
jgi:hypothetical protein